MFLNEQNYVLYKIEHLYYVIRPFISLLMNSNIHRYKLIT